NNSALAAAYRWEVFDSTLQSLLFSSTAEEPNYELPAVPGTYPVWLYVNSAHGCSDSVLHYLTVNDEFTLYIPTSFSPDNDGINDLWFPVMGSLKSDKYQLDIYNRWGELIFSSKDPGEGWNGSYMGESVKPDVYAFKLRYSPEGQSETQDVFGRINLLK
ncbi:MAG: T9SS type B sorting domain-containing protein, partial [Bacteroidota bacterium]